MECSVLRFHWVKGQAACRMAIFLHTICQILDDTDPHNNTALGQHTKSCLLCGFGKEFEI